MGSVVQSVQIKFLGTMSYLCGLLANYTTFSCSKLLLFYCLSSSSLQQIIMYQHHKSVHQHRQWAAAQCDETIIHLLFHNEVFSGTQLTNKASIQSLLSVSVGLPLVCSVYYLDVEARHNHISSGRDDWQIFTANSVLCTDHLTCS